MRYFLIAFMTCVVSLVYAQCYGPGCNNGSCGANILRKSRMAQQQYVVPQAEAQQAVQSTEAKQEEKIVPAPIAPLPAIDEKPVTWMGVSFSQEKLPELELPFKFKDSLTGARYEHITMEKGCPLLVIDPSSCPCMGGPTCGYPDLAAAVKEVYRLAKLYEKRAD